MRLDHFLRPGLTIDPKKLENGCGMIYACIPAVFGSRFTDGTFLAASAGARRLECESVPFSMDWSLSRAADSTWMKAPFGRQVSVLSAWRYSWAQYWLSQALAIQVCK